MAESTKVQKNSPDKQEELSQENAYESAPAAGALGGVWDTLHNSIGNQAIGRLVEARRTASSEGLTPVSAEQQSQIETLRPGGRSIAGAPGVRVHDDLASAGMAQRLDARAFTQGRDIFFGPNYDPSSDAGRATLAHELTHVGEGRSHAGAVQREPNASTAPPAAPNASSADNAGKVPETHYDLQLANGEIKSNLDPNQAILVLRDDYLNLNHLIEICKGEHDAFYAVRTSGVWNRIGSFLVELTGKDFPQPEIWQETWDLMQTVQNLLIGRKVEEASDTLKKAHEAYAKAAIKWKDYKANLDSDAFQAEIVIVASAVVLIVAATAVFVAAPVAVAATPVAGGAIAGTDVVVGGGVGGTLATGATAPAIAAGEGALGAGAAAGGGGTAVMTGTTAGGTAIMSGGTTAGGTAIMSGGGAAGGAAVGAGAVGAGVVGGEVAGGGTVAGVTMGSAAGDAMAVDLVTEVAAETLLNGEAAGTALAQASTLSALEGAMAHCARTLFVANSPFVTEEIRLLRSAYDVMQAVYNQKIGLGGP